MKLLPELLSLMEDMGVNDIKDVHHGVTSSRRRAQEQFAHLIGQTVNVVTSNGKFDVISRMGQPLTVVMQDQQPIAVSVISVEQAGVSPQASASLGSTYFRVMIVKGQDQVAAIGDETKSLADHFPGGRMVIRGSNLSIK